ncbi:MAG: hypothetical protein A2Y10_03795 [Planctomycetes bacterium GWF2_41_51]|nr:MAG: hypothetical protein A2Y10_03795 [Planctomycetes bacterium GWF2_41_51]HBG26037.1 hypothetical protein [Phycisphaerales bacterium]
MNYLIRFCISFLCLASLSIYAHAQGLFNPFEQAGSWHKAALHVHTTTSVGDVNVAESIARYKSKGFEVVFVTDKTKTNDLSGFSNEKFLAINGLELSTTTSPCHFLCLNTPRDLKFVNDIPAQQLINEVKRSGGEVIIAHPYWNNITLQNLLELQDYIGIEVYNAVCDNGTARGYSDVHWDQLLNKGRYLPAIAVDDTHKDGRIVALGWILIKTKELTVEAVMNSLRSGSYYASSGPIIENLKIENGFVNIKCSSAVQINFFAAAHLGRVFRPKDSNSLTQAQWKLSSNCRFVRAEVIDAQGRHAWSNPVLIKSTDIQSDKLKKRNRGNNVKQNK